MLFIVHHELSHVNSHHPITTSCRVCNGISSQNVSVHRSQQQQCSVCSLPLYYVHMYVLLCVVCVLCSLIHVCTYIRTYVYTYVCIYVCMCMYYVYNMKLCMCVLTIPMYIHTYSPYVYISIYVCVDGIVCMHSLVQLWTSSTAST